MLRSSTNVATRGGGREMDQKWVKSRDSGDLRDYKVFSFVWEGKRARSQTKSHKIIFFQLFLFRSSRAKCFGGKRKTQIHSISAPILFSSWFCCVYFGEKPESCPIMNHTTWSAPNMLLKLHNIVVSRLRLGFSQCRALSWYFVVRYLRHFFALNCIGRPREASEWNTMSWLVDWANRKIISGKSFTLNAVIIVSQKLSEFCAKTADGTGNCSPFLSVCSSYLMLPAKNTCPQNEVIEKFVSTSCVWVRVANELTLMHAFLFACFFWRFRESEKHFQTRSDGLVADNSILNGVCANDFRQ